MANVALSLSRLWQGFDLAVGKSVMLKRTQPLVMTVVVWYRLTLLDCVSFEAPDSLGICRLWEPWRYLGFLALLH